jgi:hypothetical protein
MNSAQLVNLILAKLRRVEFLVIQNRPGVAARFLWGGNEYSAAVVFNESIVVYRWVIIDNLEKSVIDNYQRYVEGRLNGLVRNDAGELVPCEN